MVSSTPRPHFTRGEDTVLILQEAGWVPGPVWTGVKSRPHRDSILEHPTRSSVIPTELPGPQHFDSFILKFKSSFLIKRFFFFFLNAAFALAI